jgi:hypothetical protein
MAELLKSVWIGTKRRYVQGLAAAFASVGVLWTITEIAQFVSSAAKTFLEGHAASYLFVTVVGFVAVFFVRTYEPRHVSFWVPLTDTKVTIKFADLFNEDADVVVAVNEYIDSEIGQRVSPRSVHGQLIQQWFSSEAEFRQRVDAELATVGAKTTGRSPGPDTAYPLGTTARISAGARQAYVFVLTHSEPTTDKSYVELAEAIEAVRQLLNYVHQRGSGRAVAIPLIGNGQSGLNLPPQHLLRLLVLLIVTVAREKALPKDVRVCLAEGCFDQLDLREIARDWRH